jgi:hypothetical protein
VIAPINTIDRYNSVTPRHLRGSARGGSLRCALSREPLEFGEIAYSKHKEFATAAPIIAMNSLGLAGFPKASPNTLYFRRRTAKYVVCDDVNTLFN